MSLRSAIAASALTGTLSLPLLPFPAAAQSRDAAVPEQVEVIKDDGRFIARVASYRTLEKSNGFIRSITLQIEWWGLLGQAVEQYGIRWEMGDSASFSDGKGGMITLDRSDLAQYPDLAERWDKLRPVTLDLGVDVTLYEPRFGQDASGFPDDPPNYFEFADFATATKHVRTAPHLMIARAGEAGTDFLPSSPQNWASFLEWRGNSVRNNEDPNAKARNTLRRTRSIVFLGPYIERIELPEPSMRTIYYEFQRRIEEENRDEAGDEKLDEKMREIAEKNAAERKLADKLAEIERERAREKLRRQVEEEEEIARNSGHEYLGAEEAKGSFVTVFYRDHGRVDGDRVRLFANKQVVARDIRLTGGGGTTRISLDPGVNRITFLALNEGTAPPNTAEFEIRDADGSVLMHREWRIEEGYEATLLILRR